MRIVIAEDAVLLRAGLVRLLTDAGHEVAAAIDTAPALLDAVNVTSPDLAIVDVRMPPTFTDEGVRAAVLIRAQHPGVAVLVLSQYVEERYAADLITSNTAGLGYLLKDRVVEVDEFLGHVARVGAGGTVFDPEVIAQILARSRRSDGMETLSPRELQVLQLMAEGRSNSAVGNELHIAESSVEKHVSAVFTKLGVPTEGSSNRRVLAVLRYLSEATGAGR
ncbi:LuxR family two component transcriptional regulator [Curtobacterium sp. PhB142]|uniref:response regulator transcription factor n=1 Tax=unclassified Curtobacterium TaxID=257496 RepID=UPI001052D94C|nr:MULTISPECIES: response regulator transcription factor [unclassified Curtobacterium]TCL80523.1 LuxR family two component transcriptional regulator [Curtobacterium sp. PhB142]TCL99763.1 LuxR family two component transcriptional regulator [Curtobacterium sp. PhB134]TCU43927.1 LuxR family two component transcriptional regulator [Curtobacterium sp. PhB146]TDW43090.1 LuxR family two component transcriptional regulator [Curtobacterium sp. PhB42]TDW53612.1 LuxR family two component transcriptional 